MEEKRITGILWWKPKQWERAKQISTDSHIFDETYQEWKQGAERALKNFQDHGIKVYQIEIDLDELIAWCISQNLPLNANARSRFTSMKVKERHDSRST